MTLPPLIGGPWERPVESHQIELGLRVDFRAIRIPKLFRPDIIEAEEYKASLYLKNREIGRVAVMIYHYKGEEWGAVENIIVTPTERRKGYGLKLTLAACEFLRKRGIKLVSSQAVTEEGYRLALAAGMQVDPTYVESIEQYLKTYPGMKIWELRPVMAKEL